MLTHLKSHGALLNVVKPEYLLEIEDFQRILQARAGKSRTPDDEDQVDQWKVVQNNFALVTKQAWNVVLSQVSITGRSAYRSKYLKLYEVKKFGLCECER